MSLFSRTATASKSLCCYDLNDVTAYVTTRNLSSKQFVWISEPCKDLDHARALRKAINEDKSIKISEVVKWYVGGKEQDINWALCSACNHWRKTPELVAEDAAVGWTCPDSCPDEDDVE